MFLKYGSFYDWFTRGWHVYSHPGAIPVEYAGLKVQASAVTERALKLLEELRCFGKPFFLFLHYWDPHTPYKPPKPFNELFWKAEPPEDGEMLDYMVAQYDGEIAYMDMEVGRVLRFLEDKGMLDETIIIVTSDHGENLMQHEGYMQHYGLYETITRIPLMVRLQGEGSKGFRDELVQHMDIAATVYKLTDVEAAPPTHGKPLPGTVEGVEDGWDDILIVENTYQKSMALRVGRWKLIHYLERSRGGSPPGYAQLYDLSKDPGELVNLAYHELDLVKELKHRTKRKVENVLNGRSNPLRKPITLRRVKFYSEARELVERMGFTIRRG